MEETERKGEIKAQSKAREREGDRTEGKRDGAKKQREPVLACIEKHYVATPLHMQAPSWNTARCCHSLY
jgi:hypothetical protein